MKITVIFTGGTIGSVVSSDGYISPGDNQPYRLLEKYKTYMRMKSVEDPVEFQVREPYQILSENLTAEYVNQLADCVRKEAEEPECEGIIVTHGTDTLMYTSALLSYMCGDAPVPVVLVSSDFPLEDERANGLVNLIHGLNFIKEKREHGVFVSYCNKGGKPKIHRGSRLLWHQPYSGSVFALDQPCCQGKDKYETMAALAGRKEMLKLSENSSDILWIRPYVGMHYPTLDKGVKAVLHDSYHSGTIRVSDEFIAFTEQAKKQGIPIYLTGGAAGEREYETVKSFSRLGIQVLPKMSPVAAYCKLWLALSAGLDIKLVMDTCIAEDICE